LKNKILPDLCAQWGSKTVILSDIFLKNLYGLKLAKYLNANIFFVPRGEKCKTRQIKERIENILLKNGYGRDTVLIALGGGATTDLAGFIASTYLRGIPLILIPTTLLSMVDASIGGKTGINTPLGKNLIGTFYPPKAVICDLETLKTLPHEEWQNGLAEILKLGLTSDSTLWKMALEKNQNLSLIQRAIAKKLEIVKQDPFEKGIRHVLNFGHTIGHAIEVVSHYKISHGQAVLLGSVAEAYLSYDLGFLSKNTFDEINLFYKKLGINWPSNNPKKFLQALTLDKKRAEDKIRIVLINQIGHAIPFEENYVTTVHTSALEKTFLWMKKNYG
jgi:3-dehydroquinate synthase